MEVKRKGLFFGLIGTVLVGFQPIVAISRPSVLNPLIFAAMTCVVEMFMFLPLVLIEIYHPINRSGRILNRNLKNVINKWKSNIKLIIFIGIIFGLNQLLFFIGYDLAGAINGSLTQKTTVFFGLIFGYAILKEKINRRQIFFSIILFIGLIIAITNGQLLTFDLESLLGVLVLLFITCLWMFGHTITKPIFGRKEVTAIQMVFLRNFFSGIVLILVYLLITPSSSLSLFQSPLNLIYFISMGVIYGSGLLCWYKTLSYLDVSKATTLFSPTPVVSAISATLFLNDTLTFFHLIGTFIVVLSIIMIVRDKNNQ